MSDKWEKVGQNNRFSDILPGGYEHDYVRNTETGEAKEVYNSGDAGILETLRQYKRENSKKYGINSIGIFGSYSKGQATDESDIDVVIETQYPDLYMLVHIKEELEQLLNKSVDLIRNKENMNPYLKKRIARDAQYV
jgi:predicted nucleotidyltransferase